MRSPRLFFHRLDQRPQPQVQVLQQLGQLGGLAGTKWAGRSGGTSVCRAACAVGIVAEVQSKSSDNEADCSSDSSRLQDDPRREVGLAELGQPRGDFLPGAEQHHGPPQAITSPAAAPRAGRARR